MSKNGFMQKAIDIASENVKNNGGPFGAVIVRYNQIVAIGFNTVTKSNDPTAHAEVNAIREACKTLNTFVLDNCELYSSCEPCPMCLSAIYWSGIKTVYFAGSRYDAEKAGFDDSFIYDELSKKLEEKTVKITQIMPTEGQKPFKIWNEFESKIRY